MKKFTCILICIISVIMMLCQGTSAAEVENSYSVYYDFIMEKLSTVGYLSPASIANGSFVSPERDGLLYARLIDFDKNGVDELFCVESR